MWPRILQVSINLNYQQNSTYNTAKLLADNFPVTKFDVSVTEYLQK